MNCNLPLNLIGCVTFAPAAAAVRAASLVGAPAMRTESEKIAQNVSKSGQMTFGTAPSYLHLRGETEPRCSRVTLSAANAGNRLGSQRATELKRVMEDVSLTFG